MRKTFIATSFIATSLMASSSAAFAGDPSGLWQTQPGESGGYLHVEVAPCAANGANVCGHIKAAIDKDGNVSPDYEHLGKQMLFDLEPDGENKWDDGEVWAPDDDKTYSANIELKGDVLVMEGCVLFFCRAQDWNKVE
ncbi:MAG: DUF2147 domain-containing protein [Pikeienuella sp.]